MVTALSDLLFDSSLQLIVVLIMN